MKNKFIKRIYFMIKDIFQRAISLPYKFLPLKNIIILESFSDYCDNTKAIFDEMINFGVNKNNTILWLVENKKHFKNIKIENVKFISIKRNNLYNKIINEFKVGYRLAQCKYYLFSHRNFSRNYPKNGQCFIYLTHGIPLKDISKVHSDISKSSYTLTTSKFSGNLKSKAFKSDESRNLILGYPRNDYLLKTNNVFNKIMPDYHKYKKIIFWLPTFRRHMNYDRNDTNTNSQSDLPIIQNKYEYNRIDSFLKEKEILLLIKPHPAQDLKYFTGVSTDNIKIIDNEFLLEKKIELYEVLGNCDGLITDYSSVYMDYLILNRPIGFTIDDFKNYTNKLGFLVDKPMSYMPGIKIKSINDMIKFIESVDNGIDNYNDERIKLKAIFHKYDDDKSSKRLLEFLGLI